MRDANLGDEVIFGEILLPGDDETQARREKTVREKFWGVLRKSARHIPFARDAVAAYYCAVDPVTPRRVKGVLLAALAYFVMPFDVIPDVFAVIGFTDDLAVMTAALALVRGHIRDDHYIAADRALIGEIADLKA
nr:YkvA family protein [uncultured Gellertiella sp.]